MSKYYQQLTRSREALVKSPLNERVKLSVVIPCFKEPSVVDTLKSLDACIFSGFMVEVIVVINESEDANESIVLANDASLREIDNWKQSNSGIQFHCIRIVLPKKHAGVGLARKTGMDEALMRFYGLNKQGVIVCLDADSLVQENYLQSIFSHFQEYKSSPGCSIYFEHPLEGNKFSQEVYEGITEYELYLRHYLQGQRYAGLPFAYHTVGSSMAVKTEAYEKVGGMNKRKAGEDFYFLHKIIKLGGFTELNSTKVIPSPRISDRVPFGTGRAVGSRVECMQEISGYNTHSFKDLKKLNNVYINLYKKLNFSILPKSIESFFNTISAKNDLENIISNCRDQEHFAQKFYHWFDAFKCFKFMHYARDHFYPNTPIFIASEELLHELGALIKGSKAELLTIYRDLDCQLMD